MGQNVAITEVSAMSDDLHQTASGKRRDVISWDEFFMSVAIAAQRRSKDPNTQVGACIASTNHRILSVGYNGTPSALNDDFFPWGTPVPMVTITTFCTPLAEPSQASPMAAALASFSYLTTASGQCF